MKVLVGAENVSSVSTLIRSAKKIFDHVNDLHIVVAYPGNSVSEAEEKYEKSIDKEGELNSVEVTMLNLTENKTFDQQVIEQTAREKVDHLLVEKTDVSLSRRLFGNAPSPIFTEISVPVTVTTS